MQPALQTHSNGRFTALTATRMAARGSDPPGMQCGLGPSVVLEDCGQLALRIEIFVRDSASEDLGAKLGVERVGRHHTSGATSER